MNLTIFAATGGVGRHLLEQARAAGHDVTAVARNPGTLPGGVRSVTADLAAVDSAALQAAVAGADGMLSCLGPRPSQCRDGITSRGTRAIIAAMQATGVRRIVVISAAPIGCVPSPDRPNPPKHDPGDGFFTRHLGARIPKVLYRDHYADLALLEYDLRENGLDWTAIRPPALTNKPLTGTYRTALGQNLPRGWFISRADVAPLHAPRAGATRDDQADPGHRQPIAAPRWREPAVPDVGWPDGDTPSGRASSGEAG